MCGTIERILYVDDEQINLDVFKMAFRRKFDILIADSGEKALEILKNDPQVSFVISDVNMPQMDGYEFVNNVKSQNPEIPCLLVSGYEENEQSENAKEKGLIVDYLTKPYDSELLQKIVKNKSLKK